MTVHGAYIAVRRTMAGLMFLSAALVTKSAFAAWQADGVALFAVGGIALFAVAAAIHFRTGQLQERARAAEVQKTTLNARLRLEAELKAAGIHVLTIRNQGAAGAAIRGGILEALADLLSPADSAQVAAAIDGPGREWRIPLEALRRLDRRRNLCGQLICLRRRRHHADLA